MASGGDSDRAIIDFTQAIKLKPDFRNAYINRANAYPRTWHIGLALVDFHRAGMYPEKIFLICGSAILLIIINCIILLAIYLL